MWIGNVSVGIFVVDNFHYEYMDRTEYSVWDSLFILFENNGDIRITFDFADMMISLWLCHGSS